jgi:hypothetical protein
MDCFRNGSHTVSQIISQSGMVLENLVRLERRPEMRPFFPSIDDRLL